jgi:hypothetical protein
LLAGVVVWFLIRPGKCSCSGEKKRLGVVGLKEKEEERHREIHREIGREIGKQVWRVQMGCIKQPRQEEEEEELLRRCMQQDDLNRLEL